MITIQRKQKNTIYGFLWIHVQGFIKMKKCKWAKKNVNVDLRRDIIIFPSLRGKARTND